MLDNIYESIKLITMTFEIEITYSDNSIQYLTSTTNYLNKSDLDFLTDLDVDLTTIKSIYSYKL